jgi:hypothetical protein
MKRILLAVAFPLVLTACEDAPPPENIRIGGACSYETTETTATIVGRNGTGEVGLVAADGHEFVLDFGDFADIGVMPEPGATFRVSKDTITSGTCVPWSYQLVGPETTSTAPVTENVSAPPVIGGPCTYEDSTVVGTILQVEGADVALIEADGTPFFQDRSAFGSVNSNPQPGDRFEIRKSSIVQGTCTPVSYLVTRQLAD